MIFNSKRFFSLVLIFAILCSLSVIGVAKKDDRIILLNETFDSYITNDKVDKIDINGEYRVNQVSDYNKALLICEENKKVNIKAQFENSSKVIVVSVAIKYEGSPLSADIGVSDGATNVYPVSIINGKILSHDGKQIGYVNEGELCNISVEYNFEAATYSVYQDGGLILGEWKIYNDILPTMFVITKNASLLGNKLWIDNILVNTGDAKANILQRGAYNPEIKDYIPVDHDAGDYKYFDNNEMNTSTGSYNKVNFTVKTNKIVAKRFDYKSKNQEKYIYMQKSTADDCYMDVVVEKEYNFSSKKTYQYFLISSDLKVENLGAQIDLFILRDSKTTTSNLNEVLASITPSGDLLLKGGVLVPKVAKKGKWFNYKLAIDLESHVADVYINDKLVKKDIEIYPLIQQANLFRLVMQIGAVGKPADLYVDNCTIWGTVNPYKDGTYKKTSVFADDTPIINYLADKTAFHVFANNLYVNGKKTSLDGMTENDPNNNEFYVSPDVLSLAFGIDKNNVKLTNNSKEITYNGKTIALDKAVIEKNGQLLVSVKEFATKALAKHLVDDNYGMYLFSDKPMHIDLSNEKPFYEKTFRGFNFPTTVESMNYFLFYERSQANTLKEIFNQKTNNGKQHPRIIATKDDFDRVKASCEKDERLNKMKMALIKKADAILPDKVALVDYKFSDVYRMIMEAYKFMDRMQYLGFAYQMTGDQKYFERAWKELNNVSGFPNLNPNHPLDTGIFTGGLAIGYDWFYDALSQEQRDKIKNQIINNSLKPMVQAYYGGMNAQSAANPKWYYTKWTSNYNTVINGGIMLGAMAVAEDCPEISFDFLEKSMHSLEYFMVGLPKDGAWLEGYSYWGLAFDYLEMVVESLKSTFKTDFGLMKYQGLDKTAYFAIALQGPREVNNFSDADVEESKGSPLYSWFANVYNDRGVAALRKTFIDKGAEPSVPEMFSYNPEVNVSEVAKLSKGILTRGTESFGIRSDYLSKDSIYLSSHFGGTTGYHAHTDNGAFVLDMLGQRWAIDLGKGEYNRTWPSSEEYRYRAEGHNALVINPGEDAGMKPGTFSKLTAFESKERGGFAVADQSQIYEGVNSAYRGFYVGDEMKTVTIRDELDLKEDSTVYWFMHTKANAIVEGNQVILTQGGKSITLRYITNAESAEISIMDAKPLTTSPNPAGQKVEKNVRKVAIKLKGKGKVNLTVKIAPIGEKAASSEIMDIPMSQWSVPDGSIQKVEEADLGCTIYSDGKKLDDDGIVATRLNGSLPEITAVPNNPKSKLVITAAQNEKEKTIIKVYSEDEKYYNIIFLTYASKGAIMLRYFNFIDIANYTVSDVPQPENPAESMFDNDFNTRWTSLNKGDAILLDLGAVKPLDGLALAFWQGAVRKYKYDIQISDDGKTFKNLRSITTDGTDENYYVEMFPTVNTRYIKVVVQGNNVNVNTNILELRALTLK